MRYPFDIEDIQIQPGMGNLRPQYGKKRDWQASLFDRFNPNGGDGLDDEDKSRLGRQGLLQLGIGLLSNGGGFGNALGEGLKGGLLAMNQGQDDIVNRQYKQAMMSSNMAGGTGMQEFGMLTDGLSPEDNLKARRIKLRLDSPAATGGMGFQVVKNADGTESMGRTNPRDGTFEVYNGQTGQLERLFGPGGQPMPVPQASQQGAPMGGQPPQDAPQFTFDDPEAMPPHVVQGITQREQASGARPWTSNTPNPYGNAMPTPGLGVSRPKEVEAGRVRAAEEAVTLGNLPYRGQIEAQNAGLSQDAKNASDLANYIRSTQPTVDRETAVTTAKANATTRAEAAAGLPQALANADQTIAAIDKVLAHPGLETGTGASARFDPRNYVGGTDAKNFNVAAAQIEGKAFLEAFQSLKGAGQITEVEGKKATAAIARLDRAQSAKEYKAGLRELRGIAQNGKMRAKSKAGQAASGGLSAAEQSELDQLRAKLGRK